MEQLVLLLVIGLISLVNWLLQRSAELREKQKQERAAQRGRGDAGLDEEMAAPQAQRMPAPSAEPDPAESMRKLMEALGLPMEAAPPVPQPAQPASRQLPEPEPPPLPEPKPETLHQQQVEAPPPPPAPTPRPLAPALSIPRLRPDTTPTRRPAVPDIPAATAPSGFRKLLSSPSGLRDAIVLSEVLGRPRGLD
jgi:hypothetical protein